MDPIMVAGLVFGVIFTAALYPACRAKGQSPWWCLLGMIGLIGVGQEIHQGEEAGLGQWREAIRRSPRSGEWTVHGPPAVAREFEGVRAEFDEALDLHEGIRFHVATDLHLWVQGVLDAESPEVLRTTADRLEADGLNLRIACQHGPMTSHDRLVRTAWQTRRLGREHNHTPRGSQ